MICRGPVSRSLWDELTEIERDPIGRGTIDPNEEDPELVGLRFAVGVTVFAIFYLTYGDGAYVYVTSIREWDPPDSL